MDDLEPPGLEELAEVWKRTKRKFALPQWQTQWFDRVMADELAHQAHLREARDRTARDVATLAADMVRGCAFTP